MKLESIGKSGEELDPAGWKDKILDSGAVVRDPVKPS